MVTEPGLPLFLPQDDSIALADEGAVGEKEVQGLAQGSGIAAQARQRQVVGKEPRE